MKKIGLFLFIVMFFLCSKIAISMSSICFNELPQEAQHTLELIKKGGPFPYARDGIVFGNFENRLPIQAHGYYREYTVPTPGVKDRGRRRIVAGKHGYYYTSDHYNQFWLIKE